MKKVVLFIGNLKFGGMGRVVLIAYQLLKEQYDVKIVTLHTNDADYDLNIEVYDLKKTTYKGIFSIPINFFTRLRAVYKMKKDLKPDIVMSFGMYPNYLNVLTKRKEKVIISIRSFDWLTIPLLTKGLDKWIVNKADSVNCVSNVIADEAERVWGIPRHKNRVIYNPYDIQFIKKKSCESVENDLIKNDYFTVVSVGRLVDQKGFNHLIKAFSIVIKEIPNAKLLIIGNGERKAELIKLISDLRVEKNVFLLGGKSNPYKYMSRADLYVLSSLSEGFPNAMVEAMCVQTPILATDCKSGPREILSLGNYNKIANDIEVCEYGVLVPPMSGSLNYDAKYIEECDKKLAEGIVFMIKNKSLRETLRKKSIERVEKFSYEVFKENLIKELESV